MYGLRKIHKDGMHYNFRWPLEVGAVVTAPDWNPEAECGGGLHIFPNAQGNYDLLDGYYWAVVEFDEAELVVIDSEKGKVPSCKIAYISEDTDGLLDFFKEVQFDNNNAYNWARWIGDREHMIQFITEPRWAYYWARDIGDREHMRQFVTEPEWAYKWALYIGDREHMRQFINEPDWAYYWALNIGDREYMIQFITEPKWAYSWALDIGDREHMKQYTGPLSQNFGGNS